MREGAKEFVLAGDHEALSQALRDQVRPPRATGVGTIYAVFPAKGGVGATTVATNLAGALQARGERTCLVDLNLNMGDVLAFLDLAGGYSIADVIGNMGRLDRDLLDATLLRHGSGIHVLAQSHRIEESDRVDAESIAQLLQFLRHHYGAVVLDGLRSFDDVSVAAVDASDQIVLLVAQEVPAVRDARRCVGLFKRLGSEGKLKLVVNRYQKVNEINLVGHRGDGGAAGRRDHRQRLSGRHPRREQGRAPAGRWGSQPGGARHRGPREGRRPCDRRGGGATREALAVQEAPDPEDERCD